MDGLLSGYLATAASYIVVALGWLGTLALLQYIGLTKASVWGTRCLAVAAIFSIFTSAFQMLAHGFSEIGQANAGKIISEVAVFFGGSLNWLFALAGGMFLIVGILVHRKQ